MEPIFLTLLLFQIKHFLCDFVFQTRYQFLNKGTYFHLGGIIHSGLHAIASLPALLVMARNPVLIGGLMLAEFLVHYHTDWLKSQIDRALKLSNESTAYWAIFGADQLVHQLTYMAMLYAVLTIP